MAYTVDDLVELILYHLVLAEETDEAAQRNLIALTNRIETTGHQLVDAPSDCVAMESAV